MSLIYIKNKIGYVLAEIHIVSRAHMLLVDLKKVNISKKLWKQLETNIYKFTT